MIWRRALWKRCWSLRSKCYGTMRSITGSCLELRLCRQYFFLEDAKRHDFFEPLLSCIYICDGETQVVLQVWQQLLVLNKRTPRHNWRWGCPRTPSKKKSSVRLAWLVPGHSVQRSSVVEFWLVRMESSWKISPSSSSLFCPNSTAMYDRTSPLSLCKDTTSVHKQLVQSNKRTCQSDTQFFHASNQPRCRGSHPIQINTTLGLLVPSTISKRNKTSQPNKAEHYTFEQGNQGGREGRGFHRGNTCVKKVMAGAWHTVLYTTKNTKHVTTECSYNKLVQELEEIIWHTLKHVFHNAPCESSYIESYSSLYHLAAN